MAIACAANVAASAQTSTFSSSAPHALIMDYETGEILYEKEALRPMAPASMTKIMTVDMVLEALKNGDTTLDTKFTVSEEAWRRGGAKSGSSTMFLKLNSKARVEDLLRGAIVQSGNDACIVLAEGLAGSEDGFATLMTARARELGMDSANFKNSTGWPHPEHRISTLDLAKLARHQIRTYPDFYPIYAERSFTWNGISQGNRNPLLGRVTGADGMKTGSTEASGYGLVGSAIRDGKRRIIVINGLGSKSERQSESIKMMEAAFSQFKFYDLYASQQVIGNVEVYMGKAKEVPVRLDQAISLPMHIAERKSVTAKLEYTAVPAPIQAGDKIADLVVTSAGKTPRRYPLYATEDVKAKSIFGKAWSVLLTKIRG